MLSTENARSNASIAPGHVSNRAKVFGQTGHASRSVLGDIGNTSARNASSKITGKPSQAKKIKQSGTSSFQRSAAPAPMAVDTFSSVRQTWNIQSKKTTTLFHDFALSLPLNQSKMHMHTIMRF